MATQVFNNSGSHLPLPACYGGGFIRSSTGAVINDTIPNVVAALASVPGDGLRFHVVADGQPRSITPASTPGDPPVTGSQLLARTPNAKILGGIAEGPSAGAT